MEEVYLIVRINAIKNSEGEQKFTAALHSRSCDPARIYNSIYTQRGL